MRNIPSDAVKFGQNQDNAKYDDDKYIRCKRCDFICNTQRDMRASEGSQIGFGTTQTIIGTVTYDSPYYSYNATIPYISRTIYDPIVSGGCAQCGCYLYDQ